MFSNRDNYANFIVLIKKALLIMNVISKTKCKQMKIQASLFTFWKDFKSKVEK